MEDYQAYRKFPQYTKWFNKLYLAERLGYECGPCGIAPIKSNYYIVRPIYNLSGMSLNASKKYIEADDYTKVPPGYFWCEWFDGCHISVTYKKNNKHFKPISAWKAYKKDLQFTKWEKTTNFPDTPLFLNELLQTDTVNIEFIGNKVIEVHLRDSPDPDYDVLIPIWADNTTKVLEYKQQGYQFIHSYENADGFLENPRIGFMVKNI